MKLGKLEDFSAKGFYGKLGILNLELENDENTLSGKFIENGKELKFLMNPSIDLKIIKIHRKCKCKHDTSYGGFFDYRYAYYPLNLLIYLLI